MIVGIGSDLLDIRRIEKAMQRHGQRFVRRCFTQDEQRMAGRRPSPRAAAAFYAKRFAAKEACAKALGTGISGGIRFSDIGIGREQGGRPSLSLTGAALRRLETIVPEGRQAGLHLSLSDDYPYAQAYVVIEAVD